MGAVSYRLSARLPYQVAAVCYRRGTSGIEFLLVNTDGGRWTFPKGGIEPHLSPSEAAANEALEEAGAVGAVDRAHFHVYLHSKGVFWKKRGVRQFAVKAFLLEVRRAGTPEEPLRNPTWFNAEEAKAALRQRRPIKYSRELCAVIQLAVREILGRPAPCPAPLLGGHPSLGRHSL